MKKPAIGSHIALAGAMVVAMLVGISTLAAGQGARTPARDEQFDRLYEQGQVAIEHAQWPQAVQHFSTLLTVKYPRADAAMYWRAYALDKMNRQADALTTVDELARSFPKSPWVNDAKALEIQVRQRSGQSVSLDAIANDDLKLFVIQGLQHAEMQQAIPMLQQVLQNSQSLRVKERALFVLAQSNGPQARQVLTDVARGEGNPALQLKAIQYIGLRGPAGQQVLSDIYATSSDVNVKRQVLRGFSSAGNRQRVLAIATTERSPELRLEAVRQLGVMGKAVTGNDIVTIYARETQPELKEAAIEALFSQQNSGALAGLLRKEPNGQFRRLIVQRLSTIYDTIPKEPVAAAGGAK